MKKFNLEEVKSGKPVITRDGRTVRIICWDRKDTNLPIVALIQSLKNNTVELIECYSIEGKRSINRPPIPDLDLFMKTEKKEGWINIYHTPKRKTSIKAKLIPQWVDNNIYQDKQAAIDEATSDECISCPEEKLVATIKIEWEE